MAKCVVKCRGRTPTPLFLILKHLLIAAPTGSGPSTNPHGDHGFGCSAWSDDDDRLKPGWQWSALIEDGDLHVRDSITRADTLVMLASQETDTSTERSPPKAVSPARFLFVQHPKHRNWVWLEMTGEDEARLMDTRRRLSEGKRYMDTYDSSPCVIDKVPLQRFLMYWPPPRLHIVEPISMDDPKLSRCDAHGEEPLGAHCYHCRRKILTWIVKDLTARSLHEVDMFRPLDTSIGVLVDKSKPLDTSIDVERLDSLTFCRDLCTAILGERDLANVNHIIAMQIGEHGLSDRHYLLTSESQANDRLLADSTVALVLLNHGSPCEGGDLGVWVSMSDWTIKDFLPKAASRATFAREKIRRDWYDDEQRPDRATIDQFSRWVDECDEDMRRLCEDSKGGILRVGELPDFMRWVSERLRIEALNARKMKEWGKVTSEEDVWHTSIEDLKSEWEGRVRENEERSLVLLPDRSEEDPTLTQCANHQGRKLGKNCNTCVRKLLAQLAYECTHARREDADEAYKVPSSVIPDAHLQAADANLDMIEELFSSHKPLQVWDYSVCFLIGDGDKIVKRFICSKKLDGPPPDIADRTLCILWILPATEHSRQDEARCFPLSLVDLLEGKHIQWDYKPAIESGSDGRGITVS